MQMHGQQQSTYGQQQPPHPPAIYIQQDQDKGKKDGGGLGCCGIFCEYFGLICTPRTKGNMKQVANPIGSVSTHKIMVMAGQFPSDNKLILIVAGVATCCCLDMLF